MPQFTPGQPRPPGAGRPPGTPNRATIEARRLAAEKGVDPFAILLDFAAGDAKALGLPSRQLEDGTEVVAVVPIELRLSAATSACNFMLPKLRAIEVDDARSDPHAAYLAIPPEERLAALREKAERVLRWLPPADTPTVAVVD